MKRWNKKFTRRFRTNLVRNKSVVGDSLEIMLERLKEGDGLDGIQDRDLVYNDNEVAMVNPITNIRSDRHELMLEEKIGEQEYKRSKMKVAEEPKTEESADNGTDASKE